MSQITDTDKSLEAMKKFAEQYARGTNTYFCSDLSVTAVVIEGLARHKDELGSRLCPCRHYEDKEAEVKNTFWNLNFNKLKRLRKEIGETYLNQLDDSLSWKIVQAMLNAHSSYLASLFRFVMTPDICTTNQLGLIPI